MGNHFWLLEATCFRPTAPCGEYLVDTLCVMDWAGRRSISASASGGCAGSSHSTVACSVTARNLVVMCGVAYLGCVGRVVSHFRVHVGRLSASVLWSVTLKKYPSAAGAYPPVLSSLGRNTTLPTLCFVGMNMGSVLGVTCLRRVVELGSVSAILRAVYHFRV